MLSLSFFFNDTATTEIYTLSLHDALPIYHAFAIRDEMYGQMEEILKASGAEIFPYKKQSPYPLGSVTHERSEEHTSELQSHHDLVCRLLLEKKKKKKKKEKNKTQKKQKHS